MAYFTKFPNIFYRGAVAKNITARPFVTTTVLNNTSLYYPYEIKEAERVDITSEKIYQTPFNDWMIYLSNNIVDPYNEWYMSQLDFQNFIIKKYGSIEQAQNTIKFYRVNWVKDTTTKTLSGYEQLPTSLKKYWNAVYDENNGRLIKYVRRQLDVTQNTNQIAELSILNASGSGFVVGEKITQGNASGFTTHVSSDTLVVKNISGQFVAGSNIQGSTTSTTALCTEYNIIHTNIASEEMVYWDSVSFYDYEDEENEKRRSINLLTPRYSQLATTELQTIMKRL